MREREREIVKTLIVENEAKTKKEQGARESTGNPQVLKKAA